MYREIYIDVVFAANFLMDYILLRLSGILLHLETARRRCAAAAAFGALLACLVLYIPADSLPMFFGLLLQCAGACVMLWIGYGISGGISFLRALAVLYLTAFVSGGFWEAVFGGGVMTLKLFLAYSAATYAGSGILLAAFDAVRAHKRNIYPIILSWQGKVQSTYGFYDTGNLLADPFSGAPVSIVNADILEKVLNKETFSRLKHLKENPGELKSTEIAGLKPRFLMCRTAGGEALMLAVILEELCIRTPKEVVRIKNPVFALAQEPSALGCEYTVLLNSRLLQ